MRLPGQEDSETLVENTLPMINIVFLLLIFFMIAGSLQNSLPFDMDPLRGEGEMPVGERPQVIHLSRTGEISFQGSMMSPEALELALAELGKGEGDQIPAIQIKSDQASNSVLVIRILSQLKAAGIAKATIAVVE